MHLRLKILSGFFILAFMLLIAGVWSIYELNSIGTSVHKILDENYKSINAAKMMLEGLEREDSATLLLIMGKWQEGRSIIVSGDSLFQSGFQIAKNNLTIAGEKAYLDSIEVRHAAYKNLWRRPIVGTDRQGNLNWYFQELHKAFLNTKSVVNDLMYLNDSTMFRTASNLRNKADRATMPGIVAIISALIFTLVFNYFVNYYMVSPIVRITDNIKKFIERKLPFNIEIETKDELADLADAIKTLTLMVEVPKIKE